MAGFTSEEVQAAVDRFLLKQVTVPRLKTGNRDVLALRDVVFDLLTTALLLRVDSYFYLVYLASNRLRGIVHQQIEDLDAIISLAPTASKPGKLIESTTDLANAQAALIELNAGLNSRTGGTGVRGSIGPAVDRFDRSVQRFASDELAKNVVDGGEVVETADEARSRVSELWSGVLGRHEDIDDRTVNILVATAALTAVRLPETTVRDIVGRIQDRLAEVRAAMEGDGALASSREALLDLLAMRTLLNRASAFRNPRLVLAPLTGDASTGVLLDSDGDEPGVLGTVSGPFNYAAGEDVSLSLNGGFSTPTVPLPGDARATLRSVPFTVFPASPPGAATAQFEYDRYGSLSVSVGVAGPFSDGPTMASSLNAALGPNVDVSWDASTSTLLFQSALTDDFSYIRTLTNTAAKLTFVEWMFGLQAVFEAAPIPPTAEEVILAFGQAVPELGGSVVEERHADYVAERRTGYSDSLWNVIDEGSNLSVSSGVAEVVSPIRNFDSLGVVPGDGLVITAPAPIAGDYVITDVGGAGLTLDPVPAGDGPATYYIGKDYRSVPVGARVRASNATSQDNTGFYRVVSSHIARVVVDRVIPTIDPSITVAVFTEFVRLFALGTTTVSGLAVTPSSAGSTALGLPSSATEAPATLSKLQVAGADFLSRGVRVGDVLDLVSPSSVATTHEITEVALTRLSFSPSVGYEAGGWPYTVQSSRHVAYDVLVLGATPFKSTWLQGSTFGELDELVGRLIRGAKFTSTISDPLNEYRNDLVTLRSALDAYYVSKEVSIDSVVKTMREQGFDRALDLLLKLDISGFFAMAPDEISYATNLTRKAATAAREVTPVSKDPRSDRVVQEWRPVSFQPDPFDPFADDGNEIPGI